MQKKFLQEIYKICCQFYPIATLGTEDGFTDETSLSQNSSTGLPPSEMLATEVFTTEMSAAEISTVDTYRRNIPY